MNEFDLNKYIADLGSKFWAGLDETRYRGNFLLYLQRIAYYYFQNRPEFKEILESAPINRIFADYSKAEVDMKDYKEHCHYLLKEYITHCSIRREDKKERINSLKLYNATDYKELFLDLADFLYNQYLVIDEYISYLNDQGRLKEDLIDSLSRSFDKRLEGCTFVYCSNLSPETIHKYLSDRASWIEQNECNPIEDAEECVYRIDEVLLLGKSSEMGAIITYFLIGRFHEKEEEFADVCLTHNFRKYWPGNPAYPVIPHKKFADITVIHHNKK